MLLPGNASSRPLDALPGRGMPSPDRGIGASPKAVSPSLKSRRTDADTSPVSGTAGPPDIADELFQSVGDMVCMLDLDGRVSWVNAAGEELTGYTAAELVGRSSLAFLAHDHRERAIEQFRERLETDANRPADDSVLQRKDGTRIPIEITSILIAGPD